MTAISHQRSRFRLAGVWYGLGVVMLLSVGILSLIPATNLGGVNDKVSHLLTYTALGAWFALLASDRVAVAWSIAMLIAYGGLLELLQGLTGYRSAEWADFGANIAGVSLGPLIYLVPQRRLLESIDAFLARSLAR